MRVKLIIAAGLALLPGAAFAAEKTTYGYDAKGRLTKVAREGGPANGVASTYTFDAADNRISVSVTGARPRPPIIVPLGGYTLIHRPA